MKKNYKIGIVKYTDHASLNRIELGAKNCLAELSEKYGIEFDYENYVYDTQADTELMKKAGQELAEAKVDLVISIATPPTVAMKDILAENKINMLFRAVSDPISAKVIDSFERPGQYITGTSDSLDGARLAQVALAAVPDAKKIGLLYNKAEFSSKMPIEEAKEYLTNSGIEWVEANPASKAEVTDAAKQLIAQGVDAVLTPTDNTVMSAEMKISPVFTAAGIPQFTGSHAFTINGAFMGMGSLYKDGDAEFMSLAVKLLIEEKPAIEVPVIRSAHTFAAINNQVCEQLGYDKDKLKESFAKINMNTMFLDTQKEFDEDSDL
ncbi:MAG: ABC transporter substrate-binding protein [Oscillospiraceae bacterium]|nr:ABC transporter substrate-binding protein [Oscillospiraceae bacterium]